MIEEKKIGLWDRIHAKRERIKRGSGEHMRRPGSTGAPSASDLKETQICETADAGLAVKASKSGTTQGANTFRKETPGQIVKHVVKRVVKEAAYQGREVPLNKPMKGDVKKSKVYVKDPQTGNVKKVNFGSKEMSIKKDQPANKKSYCARSSGQGNLTKKTSANYWSRRAWDCN